MAQASPTLAIRRCLRAKRRTSRIQPGTKNIIGGSDCLVSMLLEANYKEALLEAL